MNTPRKCHNHEAQPSHGIEKKRDEEQTITKTNAMKSLMHEQKRTAIEEPPGNGQ